MSDQRQVFGQWLIPDENEWRWIKKATAHPSNAIQQWYTINCCCVSHEVFLNVPSWNLRLLGFFLLLCIQAAHDEFCHFFQEIHHKPQPHYNFSLADFHGYTARRSDRLGKSRAAVNAEQSGVIDVWPCLSFVLCTNLLLRLWSEWNTALTVAGCIWNSLLYRKRCSYVAKKREIFTHQRWWSQMKQHTVPDQVTKAVRATRLPSECQTLIHWLLTWLLWLLL